MPSMEGRANRLDREVDKAFARYLTCAARSVDLLKQPAQTPS
jgi:hypothetical protein